ncbi:hypothetical protein JKF63_07630 [Porcisia hertigi]|uniref:Uncharacterized protein n=1 Tax=Porcisia hertigi TaxID=2761500 RepID=A0A836IPI8_9TRYP|nr:hypothetical protein JKF63_07630 [Porcisia hertigi]
MENRTVALTVLENLIHWPQPNGNGSVAPACEFDDSDNAGGATATPLASVSDAEDLCREPRQRKQDRYRGVLLLPHLCHKLGGRWAETEIVPYLLRCVEEDDAQLALVTGMALLGVTLPRSTPLGPRKPALSSNSNSPDRPDTAKSTSGSSLGAFLSVEDVQPVCALLAASSVEETRQFTAQVILPHLFFGVALERDMTLERWDLKYVPLSVLQADIDTTEASMKVNEAAEYLKNEHDSLSADAGAVSTSASGDAAASTARFVEAVRKQLLWKHKRTMRVRAATARASSAAGSVSSTLNGKKPSASSFGEDFTASPAPTKKEVRKCCYALAVEDECVQFLCSGSYATLTGPWCFEGSGRLASLCDDVSNTSGKCSTGKAVASFRCFRRHHRRLDNGQAFWRAPPATCLPLSGADLDLYGAAYASDTNSGDTDDFFSVNVRARALVASLVRWMDALTPSTATSSASPLSGNVDSPRLTRLHADGKLSLVDYLCFEGRRNVLRTRWRLLLKTLQGFLESPYPGPIATAVETTSGLLRAIESTLWETEQQQQQGARLGGTDGAGFRTAPLRGTNTTSIAAISEVDAWSEISVPDEPLLTTAQLQTFMYRMTRRHVAYCIAAAVSTRTVSMPSPPTTASTKATTTTDSLKRLVCSALVTARGALTDLLLRHRILMKLGMSCATGSTTSATGPRRPSVEDGSCMTLQLGVGPNESRAASHSVWDVSFACVSTAAGSATPAAANMPDDATFLMMTSPVPGGDTTEKVAQWLPGTLNAVSIFRLHRIVRRALLQALPLCIDLRCTFANHNSTSTPASAASIFSLTTVCPMLLQMLVPTSALPPLLNTLRVIIELQQQAENNHTAALTPLTRHIDPVGTTMVTPALWAAMTAPGSVLELDAAAAEASSMVKESPASIDFALLEAVLDVVQRLTAEAAVHLGGAIPPYSVDTVCSQLFTLLAACLRWVPRYANWKARWLIAQRLPRLTATFSLLLARISALAEEAESSATHQSTAHQLRAQTWLAHMLRLLTFLWTSAAPFGVAPLSDLMNDEEVEVRCSAARCVARCFGVATEAALRVSSSARPGEERVSTTRRAPLQEPLLLPSLSDPLEQLLDAVAQCALLAASDSDARVRSRSAEAFAGLCRTLSLLVVADPSCPAHPETPTSTRDGEDLSVWARSLHSNTDALLRLTADDEPTVKLALVAELTDLLLMRMRQPPPQSCEGQSRSAQAQDRPISCGGVAPSARGADANEKSQGDAGVLPRSADEVQYGALLQCLRQLAQHELWRLREQYAVLLAHLCGCLLVTGAVNPRPPASRDQLESGKDETTTYGSLTDVSAMAQPGVCTASWAHTHPLYQLARTELLTLLVAVLFDKAKAVRDAALDAVERMCVQHAAVSIRGNADKSTGAGDGAEKGSAGQMCGANHDIGAANNSGNGAASSSGSLNANALVDDVLWPRIHAYAPAWKTYLSRSALLRIAMRLRVDKTTVFIPLLDKLARDPVLNVRLVVAKIILEVLLLSSPDVHAMMAPSLLPAATDGEEDIGDTISTSVPMSSCKPELPSGTVAHSILMNKPILLSLAGSGDQSGGASAMAYAALPPLQFSEEERTGVILQILRQLLKDPSSDVRDEAAKALKVCF